MMIIGLQDQKYPTTNKTALNQNDVLYWMKVGRGEYKQNDKYKCMNMYSTKEEGWGERNM